MPKRKKATKARKKPARTKAAKKKTPPTKKRTPEAAPPNVTDEWSGLEPSRKDMGLVPLTLDRGVKTNVVGTVYGLDYEIEEKDYWLKVFFDYYNRRLKVIDYDGNNYGAMTKRLAYLAEENHFDKVFLKAHRNDFQIFLSHGYMMEGVLRYYFRGEDAYILSRFSSSSRAISEDLVKEAELIEQLIYHSEPKPPRPLPEGYAIERADAGRIPELVHIYRRVFESYPSPLTNPDFIKSTMERNVLYRLALFEGTAVAAASAELNERHSSAELTDCATIPEAQGMGLMQHLLTALEGDLHEGDIGTAYSLSRALSYGMNRAFFRLGYEYSGRLINNCDIFGKYEDMNIWVKRLSDAS